MIITGGHIPDADLKPSDCIIETNKICVSHNEINLMKSFLEKLGVNPPKNDNDIVNLLKKELKVSLESEIWENSQFQKFIGTKNSKKILNNFFKPLGPADSVNLLDNFNIDESLEQWQKDSQILFNKNFYHIRFQMIDFAKVKTELSYLDIYENIIKNNYNCFGCVLNTDISSGKGKHWFCIYGDLQHQGTSDDPYTLEYFNSSGNPPTIEMEIWMQKTIHDLNKNHLKKMIIIRSAPKRLQYSNTECGVWCLMYIKSRLQGKSYDWFYKTQADDTDMIKLRKHLFRKKIN